MMRFLRTHTRLIMVGVCCLAVGAGASAIASAGASGSHSADHFRDGHHGWTLHARARGLFGLARGAVHGSIVVAIKTGFATITFDRGKIDSVNGQNLTLTEGTPNATYKTVTVTIPARARIRDNRRDAGMSALRPGQRVIVVQAPRRTFVFAHTAP